MIDREYIGLTSAIRDFREARRRAAIESLLATVSGNSQELLSFEDISKTVSLRGVVRRTLENIPLDSIVGSVGRYDDFNRRFLPRRDSDESRWARVKMAVEASGLPPIEVYQIGDVYFVLDGNHRVSVSREMGATQIEAYVTEFRSNVTLTPEDSPDDIILKAEFASFLEDTGLSELRPEFNFRTTAPGRYAELREHIAVHQYFMGIDESREIPYEEAVGHWADYIYAPIVDLIREKGILRDFPDRTETDLYLWLMKHRAELVDELGWEIQADQAVEDLASRYSTTPGRLLARVSERVIDVVTPDELESGPPPGRWREQTFVPRRQDRWSTSVLVPLLGDDPGWMALDVALTIAERESAEIRGLHVRPSQEETDEEAAQEITAGFDWRLGERDIPGKLALVSGDVTDNIIQRAAWNDLVVLHLQHPPGERPLDRWRSGIRAIIQRNPRPIIAVPTSSDLERALLAYDGSPKSEEALYLSTYLAQQWGIDLVVLTAKEGRRTWKKNLDRAQAYLEEHEVAATYICEGGKAGDAVLKTAKKYERDFVLMGGYRGRPLLEVVWGSTVDQVLRTCKYPVVICR